MSKKIRLCSLFIALALFCIPLVACSPQGLYPIDDVLTQTMLSEDKTPITVLVKNAFSINVFENAVEEKFPNIDIIQV
ncbi:MAG: multiple sugar-binding protein, partial [Clostridia bacterium]